MINQWYDRELNIQSMNLTHRTIDMLMKAAKAASFNSDYDRTKFGCIIFHKNKILATGWNMRKTNPLQTFYNRMKIDTNKYGAAFKGACHAEVTTILNYTRKRLGKDPIYTPDKLGIFIYRENKEGQLALARPCISCYQAIKDFGIKNIYYTGDGSIIHEVVL